MPEGNLVGSQGSAQKGTYGKPKKPKVKVKVTKPKSPPKGPTFAVVESTPAELKAASKAKVAPKPKKPKNPYGKWGNKATWDLFHKPQESLYDEHGRFRHVYTPKKTDTLEYTPSALKARQEHPEDYLTPSQAAHLKKQREIWRHKYAEMMGKASDKDWADIQATRQGMGIDLGGFSGWLNRTHNQTLDLGRGIITAADILGHDVGHDVKNIATGNRNHEHSHTWRDLKKMGIGAAEMMAHNVQHPEDFTQNPYTALNWLPVAGGGLRVASALRVAKGLKPLEGVEAFGKTLLEPKTAHEAAAEIVADAPKHGAHALAHGGQAVGQHKVRSIVVRRPPVARRVDPAQPARPGHVYHGTTEEGAAAIEKTGRFEPRDVRGENQGQKMVWFTRDPAYAAQHGPVVLEIPESALPKDLVRVGGEGKIGPESMATTQPVVIAQKGVTLPGATKTGQFPEEGHPGFSVLKKGKAQASLFRDEEGAVKGYALYENGNIDIWVDPAYQGQGVATRLAQRLEASGADVTGALQRAVQNSTATEAGKGFATAWDAAKKPPEAPVEAPVLAGGNRAWTAWKESALPGYARAHGWEGGIATKTRSGRAASRSALGRGIQAGTDSLARNWTDFIRATRHKQSRFDQELRSGRVFEKTKSKEDQRITAFFHRQEAYIDRALQNKPEREEAFIAALEAPRGLSYREAVETKIKQLTQDGGERPANIEAQIEALHQALEGDFLESKVFDRAISSGERLSEYVDRQAAEVLGMTTEELAARRNIVAQDYADRGLLPEGIDTEARGYFPHRSVFETPKAPGGAPARPPGDIGVPQLGKSFERRQNQLKRYFGGTVLRDPAVLSKTARARNMVMYKISIRRYLYDRGKPIQEWDSIPPGDSIIIRNPDAKAEKIKPEMKMAYQDPIRAMENDDPYIMTLDEFKAKSAAGTLEPEWAKDVDNLRMISPQLKNAVMADARNGTTSPALVMSLMNALVRTVILHTPYGGVRYVTRNTAQNMLLMSLTHPAAFLELRKEVRYLVKHDKEMSDAMQVEGGTIQAGMALPDKTGKVANASSRNAQLRNMQDAVIKGKDVYVKGRKVNLGLREYGRHLGWVADEPYRMAAWIRYAKDYGFKTREQRRKLMFSDDPKLKDVRDNISQYVREDLIDFDTLSPYERNTLSQILFIYPFVKGAAKWPLMYARDYPVRTGIMALLGSQAQRENLLPPGMPHSEQEASTVHGTKYGWLVPWDPMIQDVQAAEALINNVSSGNLDISPAMDFGAPWLRQIGVAGYGGGTKVDALLKTFGPGYATVKSLQKGGGWKAQFERMMGMKVEPSPYRVKERKKDWEKVKTDWGDASDNYDLDLVTQGFKHKEDWKDIQQRAKYAGLDTGKRPTAKDNARLLNWYASQVDPEGDWHDDATLEQTNDEEFIKDYYNWMQDQLWGELDRMRRSASANRANG